jgi:hypothetical protein
MLVVAVVHFVLYSVGVSLFVEGFSSVYLDLDHECACASHHSLSHALHYCSHDVSIRITCECCPRAASVETHFPSCYKCSREIGPDNWIQLSGPISSYPARFPGCICSTMENAFPQKPCGWPWAFLMVPALRVRLCARALGLWPCGFEPTTNVVFVGTSYPARFPGCSCSTMENAFPQLPIHHDTFRRAVSLSHR